ncbi:histone-lysine N-methyltransferase trithorax-like [Littorina saxatilis]|uniref:histone-lysine N-methyltransferase trithorax-like n=1 Tax=Littorina saxatilis TaxID=31220 RepID=UPI0038B638DA
MLLTIWALDSLYMGQGRAPQSALDSLYMGQGRAPQSALDSLYMGQGRAPQSALDSLYMGQGRAPQSALDSLYMGQVHALKRVEEVRGPPADSYDKLIAWLSEMAETDNVPLDTSVFVKQLHSVCGASTRSGSNGLMSSVTGTGGSSRGSVNGGVLSAGARRSATTVRQHSASCDTRADTQRYSFGRSTYSKSFDDSLDPNQAWRQHAFSARQLTVNDDLEEDPDVRNASMESLYSGSDRDSELDAMPSTYCSDNGASRRARFIQQREQQREASRRPLLRQALLGSSTASSQGEGDYGRGGAGEGRRSSRYSGYGSCSNRSSMVTISSTLTPAQVIPCSASTGDLDKLNTALDEVRGEHDIPDYVLARRRSVSLLNLTPPGRAAYYVPDAPPPDTQTPPPVATPPGALPPGIFPPGVIPPTEMFLDDALLDGNMADILFSVEALWPKK